MSWRPPRFVPSLAFVALVVACNGLLGIHEGVYDAPDAGDGAGDGPVDGPGDGGNPEARPLALTGVTPSRGPSDAVGAADAGIVLTLNGSAFASGAVVTIAGATAAQVDAGVTTDPSTTLAVTLPPSPGPLGPVAVTVRNPDGTTATAANLFAYYATTATLTADTLFRVKTDSTGYTVEALLAADLRNTGALDLVVSVFGTTAAHNGSVIVDGAGDGGFSSPKPVSITGTLQSFATGDFNHDGHVDLAYSAAGGALVGLALGDGTGSFTDQARMGESGTIPGVFPGKFTGSPELDLLVPNSTDGGGALAVLPGMGNGTFGTGSVVTPSLGTLGGVATGDLNGDGRPDAVVVSELVPDAGGSMTGMLGNGDGGFGAPSSVPIGAPGYGVWLADFNGDGNLDAVTADGPSHQAVVVFGDGSGGFGNKTVRIPWYFPAFEQGMAVGDFNGDQTKDVAVVSGDQKLVLMLNDGLGHFTVSSPIDLCAFFATAFCVSVQGLIAGDFNRDGLDDLVVGGGPVTGMPPASVAILLAKHP